MTDSFAAIEARQDESKKEQTSNASIASSGTTKLSRLRGKLFAKHPRPDSDDETHTSAAHEAQSSASSQLLSSSRQLRTQQDEVDDFLHGGPAIPTPVAGPRRNLSLLAPRLNLAAARNASSDSVAEERWRPTKPRRREGLQVAFDVSHILIIGYGGDDALEPVSVVGRHRQNPRAPDTDTVSRAMSKPRIQYGDGDSTSSIAKDYSTIRPSTGYRQNQEHLETLSTPPHPSNVHGTSQPGTEFGKQADGRSLHHLRAEEGLTFRSAMGTTSEDEGISRPSLSSSTGSGHEQANRKLDVAALSESRIPISDSKLNTPNQRANPPSDRAAYHTAASGPTYLTPPHSSVHHVQPTEPLRRSTEHSTSPSVIKSVNHTPRMSSKPSPAQREASRTDDLNEEQSATDHGPSGADKHDDFPRLRTFGAKVAHLGTIFSTRASPSSADQSSSDWARAATWWFLRARGGLEELVRSTTAPLDTGGPSLFKAHLVNLAKVWWIMVDILPKLADSSASIAVEKTRDNLAHSFEALLRSMEKRELFPTQSLEITSGLDTSIWTSDPLVLDSREAQALKHWFPVASLAPASLRDPNAFPNLPLVESPHHFIYLRAFARAILTNIASPEAPPDTFPVLLTMIRPKDSHRPSIVVTSQCSSVDLAATLVSIPQHPAGGPKSDPGRRMPSAISEPRSSSIAITLPSLAAQENRRIIQVFPRPVDFSKVTSLTEACTRALGSSINGPRERDLVRAPLSHCQISRVVPNSSQLGIQLGILRIFAEVGMHDADGDVHGGNGDGDSLQVPRPRASTGLDAEKHRSPRRVGASLLNKGLNTLRARSRARSEPGNAEQPQDSSDERDDATDTRTRSSGKTGPSGGITSSGGGNFRATRISVVSDTSGRRIDSKELKLGGVDGWNVEEVNMGNGAGDPDSTEQTHALRCVFARSTLGKAQLSEQGGNPPTQTDKGRQEWICVFMERQQRDLAMKMLQSLQRHDN